VPNKVEVMELSRRQKVEIFLIMLTYGSATASFVDKNIPTGVVGMSTATFMFWQFLECIFEDKESRRQRDEAKKERDEAKKERDEAKKERDEFRIVMDNHARTMELIGYDIKTMTALTGVFPARFGDPEPRLQLVNHMPTESEVMRGVVSEHIDPVEQAVRDVIADILDDVCGEDTFEERRLADQARNTRIKTTTSANILNHGNVSEKEIRAREMTENELRKRAGWAS
jgi:hypothetical protein